MFLSMFDCSNVRISNERRGREGRSRIVRPTLAGQVVVMPVMMRMTTDGGMKGVVRMGQSEE